MSNPPSMPPREAHANVFKLARIGLAYLASQRDRDNEQQRLFDAGTRSLRYFESKREAARKRAEASCTCCGKRDFQRRDDYMVHASIWKQAHPEGYRGLLHLHCLQTRLGRPLRKADFTYCLSFLNRHLYDLTVEQWEKHIGFSLGEGLLAAIEREQYHAQQRDYDAVADVKAST